MGAARRSLVVGVDGSEPSLMAVDWAVDEAARHGLPLRLVYASLWERYEVGVTQDSAEPQAEQVMADTIVAGAATRARQRNPEVETSTVVLPEEAVSALLREGDSASALVTGSRGRGELTGLLLGSVSMAVAARAHCPVIVVRGDRAGLAGTHGRVLLGAGDPAVCREAVRFAVREAEARACELHTVRAWRRPAHETTARPPKAGETPHPEEEEEASALLDALLQETLAAHPGVRSRRAVIEGSARRVLLHRSAAADLLVIGVRQRHRHFGLQLGRVAHTLLHHADCPVAIVPQTN